jgi:hypothetical protein
VVTELEADVVTVVVAELDTEVVAVEDMVEDAELL